MNEKRINRKVTAEFNQAKRVRKETRLHCQTQPESTGDNPEPKEKKKEALVVELDERKNNLKNKKREKKLTEKDEVSGLQCQARKIRLVWEHMELTRISSGRIRLMLKDLQYPVLFEKSSNEYHTMCVKLQENENEVKNMEQTLGLKVSFDKVVVNEEENEPSCEEEKGLEERLRILEGKLQIIKEEVAKKAVELRKENEKCKKYAEYSNVIDEILGDCGIYDKTEVSKPEQVMEKKVGTPPVTNEKEEESGDSEVEYLGTFQMSFPRGCVIMVPKPYVLRMDDGDRPSDELVDFEMNKE